METIEPGPLPWQRPHWAGLIERWREDRLPHALLLRGVAGLGKRHFARSFAQALLCESPAATGAPCGRCRRCALFAAGSHPDFVEVIPEEEGRDITVGQIRELSGRLGLHAQYGGARLVMIDPAESMNANASNALLKTLEEPLPGTVLLLVTSRPAALLPTIRSRCQAVAFAQPPAPDVRDWVREHAGPDADPDLLLGLANGAPLAAVELAQSGVQKARDELLSDLEGTLGGSVDPVAVAERWAGAGAVGERLGWLYGLTADMVRLRQGGPSAGLIHRDIRGRLQGLSDTVDLTHLFAQLDRLTRANGLLNAQVNTQLLLEELLVAWSRPRPNR